MAKTSNVETIIRGLMQAAANGYDGATKDGVKVEIGLARDKEINITDPRVTDGFSCKILGSKLKLAYHGEYPLEVLHSMKIETELKRYVKKIATFLRKEYKDITGKEVSLSELDELVIDVQPLSRIRNIVTATQIYKIGGLGDLAPEKFDKDESKERLDKAIKAFMETDKEEYKGTKKPENVTVKKSEQNKK